LGELKGGGWSWEGRIANNIIFRIFNAPNKSVFARAIELGRKFKHFRREVRGREEGKKNLKNSLWERETNYLVKSGEEWPDFENGGKTGTFNARVKTNKKKNHKGEDNSKKIKNRKRGWGDPWKREKNIL